MKRLFRAERKAPVRVAVAAAGAPAAATLLALSFNASAAGAASLYLLAVVAAAAVGGLWSGLGAAVLSFLGLNFFFTAPRHTFRVNKAEDLIALIVFLIVAAIVGALLARALEARDRAARGERVATLLNYFASKLLSGDPLERVLDDFAHALLDPFALSRSEIHIRADDLVMDAVAERGDEGGPSVDVPLEVGAVPIGALVAVRRTDRDPLEGDDLALLQGCAKQVAVAVERTRLDRQVAGARAAAERDQLRAALFSSVTHDLRTPLASIKAAVTSLLDEEVTLEPATRRELLEAVLDETDRLNRLVGNIIDLARVRAGALVPAKQPTAIDDVIESVIHRMGPALARVRVRTLLRPDLPDVPMDPVQIDQVVSNLLENAARFSPPGGEVLVSAAPFQRAVRVRVADEGPGIPAAEREHVFEPFVSRDAGDTRMGSGLGLAIARAVVLAHGGRIWVEGAPTGGTAVVFELPVAEAEPVKQEPVP